MEREREARLIERVLGGDTDAFEPLVKEYEKNIYNLCLRMVGSREDAADLTQESFLKAYSSLKGFHGDSKFSVWLYRIASNLCVDFLRRKGGGENVSLTEEDEKGEERQRDIPDERTEPQAALSRKLSRESLRRALSRLEADYRQIILLRELEGMSYEDIGKVLDLMPGTVKSRIFRARKRLCALLLEDGNFSAEFSSKISEEVRQRE